MDDTATGLIKLCERVGFPVSFNHYDWDPEVQYRLDSAKWPREGEKGWGALVRKGLLGQHHACPKGQQIAGLHRVARAHPIHWKSLVLPCQAFHCQG